MKILSVLRLMLVLLLCLPASNVAATRDVLGDGGNSPKRAIVALSFSGGDGGDERDFYTSVLVPQLELYPDGQIILQRNSKVYEKKLSTREMQNFLARIKQTGIFKLQRSGGEGENDPLYQFDSTTEFSDGAPYLRVLVNDGINSKQFDVYTPHEKYLVPEAKRVLHLLYTFRPRRLKAYSPQYTLLLIEKGETNYYSVAGTAPRQWPSYLPTLKSFGEGQVILSGTLASTVGKAFAELPGGHVFIEAGQKYLVLARPLWPSESLENWMGR